LPSITLYDDSGQVTGTRRLVLPEGQHVTTNLAAVDFTAAAYASYTLWSTGTLYNAAGQTVRATDQQGLATENTYDLRGQQIQTRCASPATFGSHAWRA
jgi:YD repeat-containing protein